MNTLYAVYYIDYLVFLNYDLAVVDKVYYS